ncbi:hypothetical protein ACLKA6_004274 [Drosophila palustris]
MANKKRGSGSQPNWPRVNIHDKVNIIQRNKSNIILPTAEEANLIDDTNGKKQDQDQEGEQQPVGHTVKCQLN